jgi:hypothetical protein
MIWAPVRSWTLLENSLCNAFVMRLYSILTPSAHENPAVLYYCVYSSVKHRVIEPAIFEIELHGLMA